MYLYAFYIEYKFVLKKLLKLKLAKLNIWNWTYVIYYRILEYEILKENRWVGLICKVKKSLIVIFLKDLDYHGSCSHFKF